jgi:uncharacterized alpha-E superfamily protein
MTQTSRWTAFGATAAVLALGGCSTDQPAVCDSLDNARHSAEQIRNANVGENGLAQVTTGLQQLGQSLRQMRADAQAQFANELTAVQTTVDQASTSVATARETPTVDTLAALRASLVQVQNNVRQLGDTMRETC